MYFILFICCYFDLIVYCVLIKVYGWGDDGLIDWDIEYLEDIVKKISDIEWWLMLVECDIMDCYLVVFMFDCVGLMMIGCISGIVKFGVFVKLDDVGVDVLILIWLLGVEYFYYDVEVM